MPAVNAVLPAAVLATQAVPMTARLFCVGNPSKIDLESLQDGDGIDFEVPIPLRMDLLQSWTRLECFHPTKTCFTSNHKLTSARCHTTASNVAHELRAL